MGDIRAVGWRNRRKAAENQAVEPGRFQYDGHELRLGSSKVSRAFTSFAADLAMYACQRLVIRLGATSLFNFQDFAAPPPQEAVRCDADRSEAVFLNYYAVLPDMVVSCLLAETGLVVSSYAHDQGAALRFFEELDREIEESNLYRGKTLYFSGSREIEFKKTPQVSWDDVILPKALKDEILLHTFTFLASRGAHKKGVVKRGIILHGVPGTGKTTVVSALFSMLEDTDVTRIYVTNEAFERIPMDGFFNMVHYVLPAVVVFEDIDLIGPSRSIARGGVTGALLTRLDGVDKVTKPLVVIGTTNDVGSVDEALTKRPARFDRVLEIPRPSAVEISRLYARLLGAAPPEWVVKESEGLTGAHIGEVVKTAMLMADQEGRPVVEMLEPSVRAVRRSFGGSATKAGFAAGTREPADLPRPGLPLPAGEEEEPRPLTVDPTEPPNKHNVPGGRL